MTEGWYDVARSEDVGPKPVAVVGLSRDLVCYRGWSGRLHVVDGELVVVDAELVPSRILCLSTTGGS